MTASRRGVFGLFTLALSGFAAGPAESNKRLRFSDLKSPRGLRCCTMSILATQSDSLRC
jgi:hypothetical protein